MRPWTADVRAFGFVVGTAKVSAVFSLGSFQRPTNAKNSVTMQFDKVDRQQLRVLTAFAGDGLLFGASWVKAPSFIVWQSARDRSSAR